MTDEGRGRQSGPCIEVRVFVDGRMVHRQRCESDSEAESVVEQWSEVGGSEFEVDDLSAQHRAGEILEPEPTPPDDDDRREDAPAVADGPFFGGGRRSA